jgi:hypothetical protein
MAKNLKKLKLEKNLICIFLIKNSYLLIPRPPLRTSKLQEKPSALIREHPALQNFKTFSIFLGHFALLVRLWIRISNPDQDPLT